MNFSGEANGRRPCLRSSGGKVKPLVKEMQEDAAPKQQVSVRVVWLCLMRSFPVRVGHSHS